MSPASTRTRFRWVIVALLCAVAFVLFVDRINMTVAGPELQAEFRLSDETLGDVLAAFMLGYAIGLLPGGWLADRFGPRAVSSAGMVCIALGLLASSVASSMTQVTLAYGIGGGLGWTLAIVAMAGLRQKLATARIPRGLEGPGITLIIAGIMALAFIGFNGMMSGN